uniref:Ovule protein n=1 Tax=Meloidogyne incognita TaxID=6306 RepID=A0A914L835_MELIC
MSTFKQNSAHRFVGCRLTNNVISWQPTIWQIFVKFFKSISSMYSILQGKSKFLSLIQFFSIHRQIVQHFMPLKFCA